MFIAPKKIVKTEQIFGNVDVKMSVTTKINFAPKSESVHLITNSMKIIFPATNTRMRLVKW